MSRGTPWSSEEIRHLEELANQNHSLQIIALKLRRSTAAVDAKATQLNISLRRLKRPYRRHQPNPSNPGVGGANTA